MPVPGRQVTLTLGVETTIPTPSGIVPSVGQLWSVEIENVSPWVLSVNVSGKPYNLAPGMGQLYESKSGPASVTVTPSGSAASGSFYVLSNWAVAPDHIPGTFPVVVAPSLTGSITSLPPATGLLYSLPVNTDYTVPFTSPVLNVENVGSVAMAWSTGNANIAPAPVAATINWLADDQVTVVFQETFNLDAPGALAHTGTQLVDFFPALANYMTFSFTTTGGAKFTVSGRVWAAPLGADFSGINPTTLLEFSVLSLPANSATVIGWLAPTVPGDVDVWFNSTAGCYLRLTEYTANNTYNILGESDNLAGDLNLNYRKSIGRNTIQVVGVNDTGASIAVSGMFKSVRH